MDDLVAFLRARLDEDEAWANAVFAKPRWSREVEAKRAILDEHEPVCAGIRPCDTLRALAAIYSDHPDYRQEWKP